MSRVLPTRRSLLIELARARAVWPEVKSTIEFKLGFSLFLVSIAGVAVVGFLRR